MVEEVRLVKDSSLASSISALIGEVDRHTTVMMNFSRSLTVSPHSLCTRSASLDIPEYMASVSEEAGRRVWFILRTYSGCKVIEVENHVRVPNV